MKGICQTRARDKSRRGGEKEGRIIIKRGLRIKSNRQHERMEKE